MKKKILLIVALLFLVSTVLAQDDTKKDKSTEEAVALAKKSLEAHGGDKFKSIQRIYMAGKVDVTASAMNQALPASFVQIVSGDKYRIEVDGGIVKFVQVFDGVATTTSPARGFALPPVTESGILLLRFATKEGYKVGAVPDKKNGFRIESPAGYITDFFPDKKTGRIKSFEAHYSQGGKDLTTLVEIDKYEESNGVAVPSKFAQRFEGAGMTIYAEYKAATIEVDGDISDASFTVSGK
ncbi:MAG: hypothetical protein R2684_05620 [Pyrinomonadaceae bacterium]